MDYDGIKNAAEIISYYKNGIVFTGAGISVESGIPPFRGDNGIWNRYNPEVLDLNFFKNYPEESWPVIKELFFEFFDRAEPNEAHRIIAEMEADELINCVVTQNIDNLHQSAGSKTVYEFHGNAQRLICLNCDYEVAAKEVDFSVLPCRCKKCNHLLKPDFIFFGEQIPQDAYINSLDAARNCDVCIIVGSTGEVYPAAMIPAEAKRNGAYIIEINPEESLFTREITDVHLQGSAVEIFKGLKNAI
ncbi:NAD-dependent deacylase [Marinilabiliaceae bacterium ANBcel2]|nr:NAD-dependent deacylase [Marinilabiliaceae bacterium ANBcel2]